MIETWPKDISAGDKSPCKKNLLNFCALLCRQGRLLGHCKRQCAESCGKGNQQAYAVTNSTEFKKELISRTRLSNRRELE